MGGKAINNSVPIPNKEGDKVYNEFVKFISIKLKINSKNFIPLGSTLKKSNSDYGDLDIALNEKILINRKINDPIDYVFDKLKPYFEYYNKIDGIGLLSFGWKHSKGIGQIDLIIQDLNWAEFMYYSPNEGTSNYKGLFRTELLHAIASSLPVKNYVIEFFNDKDFNGKFNGEPKVFKKYTLDKTRGFKIQLKNAKGKTTKLARPLTIEGHDELISKNVNEVINILFGSLIKKENLNSFEDIWNIILSDNFKWKDCLPFIIERYIQIINSKSLDIPKEVLDYKKKTYFFKNI